MTTSGGRAVEAKSPQWRRAILWAALWGGGVFAFCFGLGMTVVGSEARAIGVGGSWGAIVFSVVLWKRLKRIGAPMTRQGRLGLLGYVTSVGFFLYLWVLLWTSLE